jgi:hypothetical protein
LLSLDSFSSGYEEYSQSAVGLSLALAVYITGLRLTFVPTVK